MSWVSVYDGGGLGLITDIASADIPPEAWTRVVNARPLNGAMVRATGYSAPFSTLSGAPHWLLNYYRNSVSYWLYPTLTACYVTDGTTHKEITKSAATYGANADIGWNGGILGGVPILNNGVDPPQQWSVDFATPSLLTDLSNWQSGYTAQVIRPFLNFLIALAVDDGSDMYPAMVKWSHPADPGAVPSSWDQTDPTVDAGQIDLAQTVGSCIDCLPLGGVNIVYKDDSLWRMQYVGGQSIFRFDEISKETGIIAQDCAAVIPEGHVVFGRDDIVVHNGQVVTRSIISGKLRRWLYNLIDESYLARCFVVNYSYRSEIWFCFPELTESYCTIALVWNYKEDKFGVIELPRIAYAVAGHRLYTTQANWEDQHTNWENWHEKWGYGVGGVLEHSVFAARPDATSEIFQYDQGRDANGSAIPVTLERLHLALIGRDSRGNPRLDNTSMKFCRGIRPRIKCDVSTTINVYVGGAASSNSGVSWSPAMPFDPTSPRELFCQVPGRTLSVKFESEDSNSNWSLEGYDMDIEVIGAY